jgi:hypothetical protein
LETLHHQLVMTQKGIYAESMEDKVRVLHAASRKEQFVSTVRDIITDLYSNAAIVSLGLEEPDRRAPKDHQITTKAEELYKEVLDVVQLARKDDAAKAEKEADEKKKRDEALVNTEPETLLNELVESKVRKARGRANATEDGAGLESDDEEDDADQCRRVVNALVNLRKGPQKPSGGGGSPMRPKNGVPPRQTWGGPTNKGGETWKNASGKSSESKGKGKGKPSSKGWKGQIPTNLPGKGKGKGKGKAPVKGGKGKGKGGTDGGKNGGSSGR